MQSLEATGCPQRPQPFPPTQAAAPEQNRERLKQKAVRYWRCTGNETPDKTLSARTVATMVRRQCRQTKHPLISATVVSRRTRPGNPCAPLTEQVRYYAAR